MTAEANTDGMPRRMRLLPRDPKRGYPVPYFVAWIDGQPDFRVVGPGKLDQARKLNLCWVCGYSLGSRRAAFLVGPMCGINRVSSEPPSHLDCATYSAISCPFMVNPDRRRRESRLPDGTVEPAGVMIRRNPGVGLVWTSRTWRAVRHSDGYLWDIGDPESVAWYAEGREATRAEVLASIESGLPILREQAEAEGPHAVAALTAMCDVALPLVPAEVSS
jgi:hypothetical protein